jgi:hypothetical protein
MQSDEIQGLNLDSGAEKLTWDAKQSEEKPAYDPGPEKKSNRRGSWAPAAAGLVFAVIFFPLMSHSWALYPAVLASYSVFIFGMTFWDGGFSIDKDEVNRELSKLLKIHIYFLVLVAGIVAIWLWLQPEVPDWVTAQGRKGSAWEWVLTFTLLAVAFWQGSVMGKVVKRYADDSQD